MFTHSGIAVEAWVKIEGNCPIKWEVVDDQAQFVIGPNSATLSLIASEEGLKKLVTTASEALRAMRVEPDPIPEGAAATHRPAPASTIRPA
ncbi:MAG: hypothetical protein ACRDTF_20525 [Pseudonocardiaceae bacterium]